MINYGVIIINVKYMECDY